MHSAPSAEQHSLQRRESLQNAPREKDVPAACASWSAQDHPFGEGHGQTGTVLGPVQGRKQNVQIFVTKELQWQNLHRERAAAPHTPRFHPTGGSFSQQKPEDDKATNSIQDAQRIGTLINTAVQTHVGTLADSCGRMAEFLAQTPWEERRAGLGATQLGIKQHLGSHNSICHRLTQMLKDLPNEAIPTVEVTKL